MYVGKTNDLVLKHTTYVYVLKYILYNYTKYTQPPDYSLSVNRTVSDKYIAKL